ncbi:TPA: EpsG family protein, partial [Streptococcus suis]
YIHTLSNRELVYNTLKEFFYNNNLTFYEFRAILTFVCGILVYFTLLKLNVNIYFFLVFYVPVFLFLDSMQFRNSIALCILIFSLYILASNKTNINRYTFLFLVIFASQIHSVYYYYLLLFFFDLKYKKHIERWVIFIGISLIFLTFLNGNKLPFVESIISIFLTDGDARLTRYLTSGRFGFILPFSMDVLLLYIFAWLNKKSIDWKSNNKFSSLFSIIQWNNYLSIILIPFIMMNMNFYRLLRINFIISLIPIMVIISNKLLNKENIRILLSITLLLGIFWVGFELFYNSVPIYTPVFQGSFFWE